MRNEATGLSVKDLLCQAVQLGWCPEGKEMLQMVWMGLIGSVFGRSLTSGLGGWNGARRTK